MLRDDLLCRGEFFYVRYAAHILILIVQDGFMVIGGSLHKVRENVKYVTSSETRELLFKKCVVDVNIKESAGLLQDVQTI